MRSSDIAPNSSGKLPSRNRRAVLQGIAGTMASPALIASQTLLLMQHEEALWPLPIPMISRAI